MGIRHVRVVVAVIASLMAGCTTPAGGRWPQDGVVSPKSGRRPAVVVPASQFALSVATERSRYLVGEPVYVAITLRNTSGEPQRVTSSLRPEDGAVHIVITSPDGKQREFVPLGEADHDATVYSRLAPGETIGNVAPIFFGGNGWTFSTSGRYTITAYYRLPDGQGAVLESKSQPLVTEIQPSPEGSSLIGEGGPATAEVGKFLTWQSGDHLEKGRARLRELTDRSPDSVLTSYAHVAFARSWGDAFMNYGKREVRPPNCELALQHLSKVLDEHVTEYVRLQGAITAARCMVRAKNSDAARRYIGIAKEITRDRPEYREIAARASELDQHVNRSLKEPQ